MGYGNDRKQLKYWSDYDYIILYYEFTYADRKKMSLSHFPLLMV